MSINNIYQNLENYINSLILNREAFPEGFASRFFPSEFIEKLINPLFLLLITPIIGIIIVFFYPYILRYLLRISKNRGQVQSEYKKLCDDGLKNIGLLFSILTFIISIYIWIKFDYKTNDIQNLFSFSWIQAQNPYGFNGLNFVFGIDGISLVFILLTTLIIPICILCSWNSINYLVKAYIISFLLIEFLLIGVFTILDVLGFYVFFEGILIPMFLIIGIWGSREQKISAAYYFFFYTLLGSILMLLSIIYIYYKYGTTDYLTLISIKNEIIQIPEGAPESWQNGKISIFSELEEKLIFLAFFASLAVKIPKFPFHIWLPQAHVEAPVAGSVILAGILIKLGSYGFIRYSLPLLPNASIYFAPLIFTLSIVAIIYASLTTLRQTDFKRIIAYSSVSHMAIVTIGIFSLTIIGIEGSIFLQIAHGLVSSALFIIVTLLYDRFHTRLVKYYKGITIIMPLFSIFFLIFTLANIGIPLSCNFIGEFTCLLALFMVNGLFITLLASTGIILSAAYALFLYNRVSFGKFSLYLSRINHDTLRDPRDGKTLRKHHTDKNALRIHATLASNTEAQQHPHAQNHEVSLLEIEKNDSMTDITRREFYVLLPLCLLTIILGVWPNIIFDILHSSVTQII